MISRYRFAPYLIAAWLLAIPSVAALAESTPPGRACFQIMATPSDGGPSSAILLDACTGQTWILVRSYQPAAKKGRAGNVAHRWEPLSKDSAEPPPARKPAPTAATGNKCFTFQGRRFCE
jgi:hypothetical protein